VGLPLASVFVLRFSPCPPSEVHHRTISLLREAGGIFRVGTACGIEVEWVRIVGCQVLGGKGSVDSPIRRRNVKVRRILKGPLHVRSDSSCIWISCPRYSPGGSTGRKQLCVRIVSPQATAKHTSASHPAKDKWIGPRQMAGIPKYRDPERKF
jgi:hypothetical protein